ncbi:MAG TPA: SPOR domain-containing protein, partial [Alphaproteobacteria bacterium]|nr:SPOR domain-containing protein [Alphaproteobacteria bacterium]
HDQAEALKWFRLAADQGNQQARHNLDFMKSNKVEAVVKAEPPDEDLAEPSHVVTITEESEPETGEDSQTAQSQAVDAASMPGGEATAALDRPKEPELETIVAKKTPSMLLLAPKADEVVAKEDQADEPAETAEVSRQIDALKKLKTPKEEAKTAPDEAEVVKAAVPPAAEDDGPKTVKAPEPAPVEKSVSAKADPGQMSDSAGAEDASLPTKKASAQTGRYLVQLGALKTGEEAKAKATAARLTQSHKAALGELQVSANRADLGERGVFYRLRAGPVADLKAARALCEKLGARKQACIVVQP